MDNYCKIYLFDLQLSGNNLISDYSLDFSHYHNVCLLGESGSGKSLLLKALYKNANLFDSNAKIAFYFLEKENAADYRLTFQYDSLTKKEQTFLDNFLKSENFAYRVALMKKVMAKPHYLFCENLHFFLNYQELEEFINFINDEGIKLFYVTSHIEETPFFQYIQVLKNGKIAIEGERGQVYKEEKIMKRLGFSLPFYVNMSTQLGYYGLVEGLCFSNEELERSLWK